MKRSILAILITVTLFFFTSITIAATDNNAAWQSIKQTSPQGAKRGPKAIQDFKDKLPGIAASYRKSPAQLEKLLLTDKDLWISSSDKLFYACTALAKNAPSYNDAPPVAVNAIFPYSQTFLLHSNPSATRVIYLDFDGHVTNDPDWNSGITINSQSYNSEGISSTFSNAEQDEIQNIWALVAEDYIIYDVDVTTEDPGVSALVKSSGSDQYYGIRMVISPTSSWFGPWGGVAYLTSFNWDTDTPAFVFPNNLGPYHEKFVAEAVSHEAGHSLGLHHDGKNSTEYYAGHGVWAPIMGDGGDKTVSQWSKGEYIGATNTEDDLVIIQTEGGFGYRTDDHGNTTSVATSLGSGVSMNTSGIIETRFDIDMFSFIAPLGDLTLNVSSASPEGNLDLNLQLLNSAGTMLEESDSTANLTESIFRALSAGTYYIRIEGVGAADYTDYASIGQYSISGSMFVIIPEPPVVQDSSESVEQGVALLVDLDASDDGLPSPPGMDCIILSLPGNGTISDPSAGAIASVPYTLAANGKQVLYTPFAFYTGLDSFTFKANDGGTPPSGGDSTSIATVTLSISSEPIINTYLYENFEAPFVSGAPAGWSKQFNYGSFDWIRGTGNNWGIPAHEGTYNALLYLESYSYPETYLITPAIEFAPGVMDPTLEFWHMQRYWSFDLDTLEVYYRTSSGGTWTLLASYMTEVYNWTKHTIPLPNTTSTYYIGFLGHANYGDGLCIDAVTVTGEDLPPAPPNADLDADEKVDIFDYAILNINWGQTGCTDPGYCQKADINKDTFVNFDDLEIMANQWLDGAYYLPPNADLDDDERVDVFDYAILNINWGQTGCTGPGYCQKADINKDTFVNFDDLEIMANQWLDGTYYLPPFGDINDDGKTNYFDYVILNKHWLETGCVKPFFCEYADIDGNGTVDIDDLREMALDWLD